MSEISQLPPPGVLSEQMAYRIAAVIHPQNADSQPGEINDDIDYEASLRQRASQLDPESEAIIDTHSGNTYVEKELRALWLEKADIARSCIHERNDRLAAEYEFEDKLIEEGVFTADTDERLKEALKKEYEKKEKLVGYIKNAAEDPTDKNLRAVEVWSGLHTEAKRKRKQLERQISRA